MKYNNLAVCQLKLFFATYKMEIPEYNLAATDLFGRVCLVIGSKMTGKTTVIRQLMRALPAKRVKVFTDTPQDKLAPESQVHKELSEDELKNILESQIVACRVYEKVNCQDILVTLYARCSTQPADLEQMKATIRANRHILAADVNELSGDELFVLENLDFDPNILLVIDGLTSTVDRLKYTEAFKKLFHNGRRLYITTIISAYTDKALTYDLRNNAALTIFTDQHSVNAYVERQTNNLPKDTKRLSQSAEIWQNSPSERHLPMYADGKLWRITVVV